MQKVDNEIKEYGSQKQLYLHSAIGLLMPKKRAYEWNAMKIGIDPNTPRMCKGCNKLLPVGMFPLNGNGYYEGECLTCKGERMKKQYSAIKAARTDYYWEKRLRALRQGAIRRGLSFNLTIDDLRAVYERQDKRCWYTGEPLVIDSIDRIDVERGYAPDNIIMCEKYVNVFRGDMSRDAFIDLCHKIARNHPLS